MDGGGGNEDRPLDYFFMSYLVYQLKSATESNDLVMKFYDSRFQQQFIIYSSSMARV